MDRVVKKKKWGRKKIVYTVLGVGVLVIIIFQLWFSGDGYTLEIDENQVTFSETKREIFQEYIVQTGAIVPKKTYYLDAVEGGNIIKTFKESGAILQKGDPIVELENINLKLSVLSQENSLNEQINRVRTTRLQLDQNYLSQKQELAEIENQIQILRPQYYRDSIMSTRELISDKEFEKTEADYRYNTKRKEFTYESFKNDSTSRMLQSRQLNMSEASMIENLRGVRKILDNLIIRAPIDGQLSTPEPLQEGQNVNKGDRLGEIDVIGTYKVRAQIDELYLPRIAVGLQANTTFANNTHQLVISYIYPTIKNGKFEVDMEFVEEVPEGIKKGQSARLKIALGKSSEQLVIPTGGFYNTTGGDWAFVIEEGKNRATKRIIRLGRKNSDQYEVLEGLEPGDRVITSSYENFGDAEKLVW
ncbi:efflux RND transporter periplasmic adaptor subunit [Spongiimicrobium salis]|uniref:efflux RND transporter periplasmic adaptor subunit n=1 Tax=Spongiimicrobium salis TaxID=1667022 RepID=UPI00374DD94B